MLKRYDHLIDDPVDEAKTKKLMGDRQLDKSILEKKKGVEKTVK